MGNWSSGMIPVLGTGGPGSNSRISPILLPFSTQMIPPRGPGSARTCCDETALLPAAREVACAPLGLAQPLPGNSPHIPKSCILYPSRGIAHASKIIAVVSGTLYGRELKSVLRGTGGVRTIAFPRTTDTYAHGAFCSVWALKSAVFPEGLDKLTLTNLYDVPELYTGLFNKSGLARVRLPSALRVIGALVFHTCSVLREVELPVGLEVIDSYAFRGSGIVHVAIPASVVSLGYCAFQNCKSLVEVTFAKDSRLKKICGACFMGTALREIALPASLEEVETAAFFRCPDLRTIYAACDPGLCDSSLIGSNAEIKLLAPQKPLGPAMLGNVTLQALRGRREVVVPDVERIGEGAFEDSAVERVFIPASVRAIEKDAFRGCARLKKVAFAPDTRLERVEAGAFRGTGLQRVEIPRGVRVLGECAFAECGSLKTLVFQPGALLEQVGAGCFSHTGLSKVVFPENVREVGSSVFEGCARLRDV